ncbi:MAG: amidohydrolase family protein [Bacillota bacterium]
MKTISVSNNTTLILRPDRIFNGNTQAAEDEHEILIKDGVIKGIYPHGQLDRHEGKGAEKLDLPGHTILPGLVDSHVHLALDGIDFRRALEMWNQPELLMERIGGDLSATLRAGIVAVRDGGDRKWIGLRTRNSVMEGALPGPRIISSGMALGKRGKYGSFLGPGIIDGEIRKTVEDTAQKGVDLIKVLVSGVVSFKNYRRVGEIQFSRNELCELVATAHHLGLRVMAHASSDEAVQIALQAGVDSLEHGYFISEQSLADMAGSGTPWVPTIVPVANQVRGRLKDRHTPENREVIEMTYRRQQRMVRQAAEMGVRLGIGTDAGANGVLHGTGLLEEMLYLAEAGLTPEEILRCATGVNSSILGLEREMGMIKPGLPPYLIAVNGNPLKNLEDLKKVELMIISAGQNKSG